MPKTCYIHFGLHKTASTSFQESCANNTKILEDNGIYYPIFLCRPANKLKITNHSIPIFSMCVHNPSEYHVNKRWGISDKIEAVNSSYKRQLEAHLGSAKNLLFSGEDISMLGEARLSRFIDKIKDYGYKIKATALVRSPYSMLCSQLQETIKGGKYTNLISLNNSSRSSHENQINGKANILKKLQLVLNESIGFHSFERACADTFGPAGYLFREFLGLDPAKFEYTKGNESYSNLTVRLQNEFNKINPAFDNKKMNPSHLKLDSSIDHNFKFSGKFLLTEHEHSLVKEFLDGESEALYKLTGMDEMLSQTIQFSNPIYQ